MTRGALLRQGAGDGGGILTPGRKLMLPRTVRDVALEVDDVYAVIRGGRVGAIFTRGGERNDRYRTASGLTAASSPLRTALRRLAPGASCRPLPANRSLSDLCRLGPSTYWGPCGGGAIQGGFFAIWPGARTQPAATGR